MAAHPLFSSFVAAACQRRDALAKSAQREGSATSESSSSTVN
jgi:hypothetical protein